MEPWVDVLLETRVRPDALKPLPVVIWVDVLLGARVRHDAWQLRNRIFLQNPGLKLSDLAIPCILQPPRMGPIHKFMYGRRGRGLVIITFMIMSLPPRWGTAPQCIRKQAIPYYKMALFFRILPWSFGPCNSWLTRECQGTKCNSWPISGRVPY